MVDIEKQVAHWLRGAEEDWEVANILLEKGKVRHALFFAHLTLEKNLKAHVCRNIGDLAPRIHNPVRLAELAGIELSERRSDILFMMNDFNLEGRYPEMLAPLPTTEKCRSYVDSVEKVFQWLKNQL